jgi:squalene synthase HpnC
LVVQTSVEPSLDDLHARAAGENFPVATRVLPRRQRAHLLAVYAAARLIDEIGDTVRPGEGPGDRLRRLHAVDRELDAAAAGGTRHPVFRRLGETMRDCAIGAEPFHDLVEANRWDQRRHRYETFGDLRGYCRLSAEPVGRIVLAIFDVREPEAALLSDQICAALQLAEHWQDIAEDARAGRVYVPQEDLDRFAVAVEDLDRSPATPALRALVAFEVERARRLLEDGAPLVGRIDGRARWAVAGFVAGGHAALDAVAAAGFDVTSHTPRPSGLRFARRLVSALTHRSTT